MKFTIDTTQKKIWLNESLKYEELIEFSKIFPLEGYELIQESIVINNHRLVNVPISPFYVGDLPGTFGNSSNIVLTLKENNEI